MRNRNEKSARTNEVSPVFLSRLNVLLDGHHALLFNRINDTFIFGFGTIKNEFLAFNFASSCLAKKTIFKSLVFLSRAKLIGITFIKVLQNLISVHHRLVV